MDLNDPVPWRDDEELVEAMAPPDPEPVPPRSPLVTILGCAVIVLALLGLVAASAAFGWTMRTVLGG